MKILHVNDGINIKYVAYFMSITRLIGDTHKRYWISEYSKVNIPLPPKAEQDRIVTPCGTILKKECHVGCKSEVFDSIEDFWSFFNQDYQGMIIHWTDTRY